MSVLSLVASLLFTVRANRQSHFFLKQKWFLRTTGPASAWHLTPLIGTSLEVDSLLIRTRHVPTMLHLRKAEVCPKLMLMVLPDVEHLDRLVIVPDIHRTCGLDEELRATG